MTKQEEIKEGIKNKLLFDMGLVSPMIPKELEYNANALAGEILTYLHSQGVVVQIEGYLVKFAGDMYIKVEPLIKGVNDATD